MATTRLSGTDPVIIVCLLSKVVHGSLAHLSFIDTVIAVVWGAALGGKTLVTLSAKVIETLMLWPVVACIPVSYAFTGVPQTRKSATAIVIACAAILSVAWGSRTKCTACVLGNSHTLPHTDCRSAVLPMSFRITTVVGVDTLILITDET